MAGLRVWVSGLLEEGGSNKSEISNSVQQFGEGGKRSRRLLA